MKMASEATLNTLWTLNSDLHRGILTTISRIIDKVIEDHKAFSAENSYMRTVDEALNAIEAE